MAHRLSAEAESQLDAIWLHIAIESGALESADRIIDTITDRFWLLARYPHSELNLPSQRYCEGRDLR